MQLVMIIVTIVFTLGSAIAQENVRSVDGPFKVTIDYSKSISEMISSGNYPDVDPNFYGDSFPVKGSGIKTFELYLVRLLKEDGQDGLYTDELKRLGYKLAGIEHLIAFGSKYVTGKGEYEIYALGSLHVTEDGMRIWPYLGVEKEKKQLNGFWLDGNCYDEHIYYLVYKTDQKKTPMKPKSNTSPKLPAKPLPPPFTYPDAGQPQTPPARLFLL